MESFNDFIAVHWQMIRGVTLSFCWHNFFICLNGVHVIDNPVIVFFAKFFKISFFPKVCDCKLIEIYDNLDKKHSAHVIVQTMYTCFFPVLFPTVVNLSAPYVVLCFKRHGFVAIKSIKLVLSFKYLADWQLKWNWFVDGRPE